MPTQIPKLPPLSTALVPSNGEVATTMSSRTSRALVSSTKVKYVPAERGSDGLPTPRILTPRDLHVINKTIDSNAILKPQHRALNIANIIPEIPYVRVGERGDDILGLTLAKVSPAETALDIPLRLATPSDFHIPAAGDLPMGVSSSPAMRISALLKGTSQVPQHSPEEKQGPERDNAHCVIIGDWEMRATAAKRAHLFKNYALAQLALAGLYYRAGNTARSRVYLSDSAQAFEHCGDLRGAALTHNLLGVASMLEGAHDSALVHHMKQASISGSYGRAVAQLNIGVCYGALGKHESALSAFGDALRSATDAADNVLETIAHGNLAIAYLRMGSMSAAQREAEQCLERCSVAGDKIGAAVCLLILADTHLQLSDYPHAQFYGEHALRVATEARSTDMARVARVVTGLARGAQNTQTMLLQQARAMGVNVAASQILEALPAQ